MVDVVSIEHVNQTCDSGIITYVPFHFLPRVRFHVNILRRM